MHRSHSGWSFPLDQCLPKIRRNKDEEDSLLSNRRRGKRDRRLRVVTSGIKKVYHDRHTSKQREYNREIINDALRDLDE